MASEQGVTGPLTDIVQRVVDAGAPHVPADLRWDALLLMLVIAVLIWWLRGGHGARGADGRERRAGLVQFLLPRDIYTHPSARVDVYLYVFERLFHPLWAVALLATVGPAAEQAVIGAMETVFGPTPALESNYAWMLLYSLVALLCFDFVFFLTHYTMHKVPALWSLHKVHHSAEVLTPLTRYREHVLVGPIWAGGSALAYGFAAGIFAWLFNGGITEATLLNLGFFMVLFGFNGAFRHYHVQFNYPRWLSRWLHSPAMHHVHHSYLPQHWDKNFAAVTSIYDRLFGTLYIPDIDEHTPWGIGPAEQGENRSFWHNTIGPFRDWYRMLRRRGDGARGTTAD